MKVVLVKNSVKDKTLVNGTRGVIIGFRAPSSGSGEQLPIVRVASGAGVPVYVMFTHFLCTAAY